ncbi:AI-2 transport protein TqsA [Symmachiella macrocystis]|uniref:AI-2 transport protein TqsA n=1 Tax=Symmachiella macrocystis TaxID=2527985 RepID=A0A5C6BQM7_9PLAN|nr:AI-2E family transporter [Symmachiella macrocystis]TWU14503.1 AI-2 transport protein TqsA [Symmachiella macrocystis]
MVEKNAATHGSGRSYTLLILAFVIASLYLAKEILLPLSLAILLSFVLTPLVSRLERLRLGRIPSVVIVCAFAFSAIGGAGWLATNQLIELSMRLPDYKDNLIDKIHNLQSGTGEKLEKAKQALEDIGTELSEGGNAADEEKDAAETADPPALQRNLLGWLRPQKQGDGSAENPVEVKVVSLPPSPLNQIQTWLGPLVAPLSTAGIVVVLVVFILVKREDLRNRVIQLVGTSNLYATTEAIEDATDRLSRYLRMQLLINIIYGVVVAVTLMFLGVPNAILWGVMGTMLRFLPYIGPWISAVMPIALTMAISDGWTLPLMTIGLFVSLELVVNNVLEPWLYGSSIGVSSLGVILAAIFWTWLWGPVGLVLAMPLTVCLVVLGKYVPQLGFLPLLLGDRTALEPYEQLYQRLLTAEDYEANELAEEYLKDASVTEFYDDVLMPALQLAEQDRHADLLSEQQETVVNDSARELVEELGERLQQKEQPEDGAGAPDEKGHVLCIPVRDQADETVALMTGQLLRSEGCRVDVGSINMLAGEAINLIETQQCQIAILILLPPLGARKGRYLCKRLSQQYPDLHIVVALMHGEKYGKSKQRLLNVGADVVATNLPDLITSVRQARFNAQQAPPSHNSIEDTVPAGQNAAPISAAQPVENQP